MFRVPTGTTMTTDLLAEYMGKHNEEITMRYKRLQDAYCNDYLIIHEKKKEAWKPDNRIPVNFAKYITDTFNGFVTGIPIKITNADKTVSNYIEFLDQYNDQDDNNSELSKICDMYGNGYEMYYIDEDGNECITYLTPMEAFMIYDDSIIERPLFFVRHYIDSENVERGSWSDGTYVQHFMNDGTYKWVDEPKKHGFKYVPAVEYIENNERMGVYESVLPMIDAYNKAISEKANDVDYFADAYLKVLGAALETDSIKTIRDNRIINLEGEGAQNVVVDFMDKPNGDTTQENLIDRLEKLIFMISMVANISDENFGASSGIALKYKLQAMNNLAKTKERKLRSGMAQRYKILFSNPIAQTRGVSEDAWLKNTYIFTRNFPSNVLEESQIAGNLEGIVSKETQLSALSIVENIQEEIDRMKREEEEAQESIVERRMFGNHGEEESPGGDSQPEVLAGEGRGTA